MLPWQYIPLNKSGLNRELAGDNFSTSKSATFDALLSASVVFVGSMFIILTQFPFLKVNLVMEYDGI